MTLIYDEYNEVWVWVVSNDHDMELSPQFDEEVDARSWLKYIKEHING